MTKSKDDKNNSLFCSFCGKSQHEVKKLIAGPTVFVCYECVELCMDIIKDETRNLAKKPSDKVASPSEICKLTSVKTFKTPLASSKCRAIPLHDNTKLSVISKNL